LYVAKSDIELGVFVHYLVKIVKRDETDRWSCVFVGSVIDMAIPSVHWSVGVVGITMPLAHSYRFIFSLFDLGMSACNRLGLFVFPFYLTSLNEFS
jgi:hypothetical protein